MTDRVGQQLGNYRLTRLLGEGGFAEVYLADHTLLGTTVAIKVLHTRVTQEDVALFQQEARLLASLKHPHIVRVLDFGIEGQIPYLVMDYAPNGTLRTRHRRETTLPVTTVVDYVKQVAQALQYAHDRKIVHRDIKPENMLLDEHGNILLSDFGIALITQSSRYQSTKEMAGTMAYSAPEQIQGKPRAASDQYALGIVVYEWLSGDRPFHGSFPELVGQHLTVAPPSLRDKLPHLSSDIEHVVFTALAKQPENRYPSIQAFAQALEQASQGLPPTVLAPPVTSSSSQLPSVPVSTASTITPNPLPVPASSSNQPATPPQTPLPPINPSAPLSSASTPSLQQSTVLAPPASQTATPPLAPTLLASPSTPLSTPATSVPSPLSQYPSPEKTTNTGKISRRTILIGAAGVVVVAGVGTGVFLFLPPQGQLFVYRGHSFQVNSVAWSPDGKRIASGSADNTVQVWNASDGSNVFTYKGHSYGVLTVAWSPDGKHIASGSNDCTVQVWNASDGSNVFTYKGHSDYVNTVAWSPDGQRIASGSRDNTVQVWNASDGSNVFTYKGHSSEVYTVAWSPDGKRIASGSADKTVQVWNASDGSNVFTYKGHSNSLYGVLSVAWSPDGQRIASAGDRTVQVWNASDGSNVFTYKGHSFQVNTVAWSPDGQHIASGSGDKTAQVWNASDGSNVFTYKGHSNWVMSVAWSPDGQRIASGSGFYDATVQVWQAV